MRNAELKNVDARLHQWAYWSRSHGIYLGYPRQNIIDKIRKEGIESAVQQKRKNGIKPIDMPKEVEAVEKALILMRNPKYSDVIQVKYLQDNIDQDCAIELSIKWDRYLSISMFRKMLERALYWLDGRLHADFDLKSI